MVFIPIVRKLENGKRYATYDDYNFSFYYSYWKQLFTGLLKFSYTSIDGIEI